MALSTAPTEPVIARCIQLEFLRLFSSCVHVVPPPDQGIISEPGGLMALNHFVDQSPADHNVSSIGEKATGIGTVLASVVAATSQRKTPREYYIISDERAMKGLFRNPAITILLSLALWIGIQEFLDHAPLQFVLTVILMVVFSSILLTSRCPRCGDTYGITMMNYVVTQNCCKKCARSRHSKN